MPLAGLPNLDFCFLLEVSKPESPSAPNIYLHRGRQDRHSHRISLIPPPPPPPPPVPAASGTSLEETRALAMSFAIEVPGEANPLNLQELYKALQGANSLDNAQRQAAGKQLTEWESHQDFYPSLQVCRAALFRFQKTILTIRDTADHLSRQDNTPRSPLPCRHRTEEWHRQTLAPCCSQNRDQTTREKRHQIEVVSGNPGRREQEPCTA